MQKNDFSKVGRSREADLASKVQKVNLDVSLARFRRDDGLALPPLNTSSDSEGQRPELRMEGEDLVLPV